MKNHDCSVRVYNGTFTGHMCSRNAKVERDGAWYCGIHDPEYVAKKREYQQAKWEAEWNSKNVQWARADGLKALGELILTILKSEPNEPPEFLPSFVEVDRQTVTEIARKHGLIA